MPTVGKVVHILGIPLAEKYTMRYALTKIYGIGEHTAHKLCARFQLHDRFKVRDLSPVQITAIASFLSSPATATRLPRMPLADPNYVAPPQSRSMIAILNDWNANRMAAKRRLQVKMEERLANPRLADKYKGKYEKLKQNTEKDPLSGLKIESELRREIRENVAHQRRIGSYVGRRHAMHLPVRGQNTQSNAKTARKLNYI